MDTMASFVYRMLFIGAVMCITASANLMMEYNWPEPDRNINRFPHESSCHYYYLMLSEEDITIEKCPDGQMFDYVKHSCISDKEHLHCWSRHFGKIKHDHLHLKHKKHFRCPYPWGKYPNLHDCTKYHLCLNGKSRVKKCAHYELFDKISRKCIASINAVCADKTDVVEHGYVCPKAWGSFTFSKDCSKYYECLQKKPSLRTCQKGKLFDDRLRKCASSEHVYCGLRHNPYEKMNSVVPETSSVPITNSVEISTASTPQEVSSTLPEFSSTLQKVSSTNDELSSTLQEASSTIKDFSPDPQEISSTVKEITSTPQEDFSTINDFSPSPQEASLTSNETILIKQKVSSNIKEITSTNQSPSTEITSPPVVSEVNIKEAKQDLSKKTLKKSEKHQETNDVVKDISRKNEFIEVSSTTENVQSKIASEEKSEELKKDVSTEEIDTNDVSKSRKTPGDNTLPFAKTGCLPKDSMCTIEKDGTVLKCSSSKDLQPHPKDERRFLDCTENKIQVYTCPQGLTFDPNTKKCKWQFIMG